MVLMGLIQTWSPWTVLSTAVDDRSLQMKLFEHPLLRVEVATRVQGFHQAFRAGNVFRDFQLLLGRWRIAKPDQF